MTPVRNTAVDAWRLIERRGPAECWPFTGAPNTYGYGQMRLEGKHELVHRIVYRLATGDDPGDFLVCHSCDNPRCCNPGHLFVGTVADNNADAVRKGRSARGERAARAKLSEPQVREIRALRARGLSFAEIGPRFSVTPENASLVCRGKTWRPA